MVNADSISAAGASFHQSFTFDKRTRHLVAGSVFLSNFGSGPREVRKIGRGNTVKAGSPASPGAWSLPSGTTQVDHASSPGRHERRVDYQMVGATWEASARRRTVVHPPTAQVVGNGSDRTARVVPGGLA